MADAKIKVKVIYPDGMEEEYWTLPGTNLWQSLAVHGIDVAGSCSGKGTCGQCKVRIEGKVNERSSREREYLLAGEIERDERLACYCEVRESLTVYLDYTDISSDTKTKLFNELSEYQASPRVSLRKIYIAGLDKENPVPIQRRIKEALKGLKLKIDTENWNELALLDRAGRPALELWALLLGQKEVRYLGREPRSAYGIVLDIGSTSIFAALIDLQNGKPKAMASRTNMQRVYGADIISRISYCLENPEGLPKMRQVLLNSINAAVEELIQESVIEPDEILEYAVVGNPVMLHFFLGLNPSGFAMSPYNGIIIDEMELYARELGLIAAANTRAYILSQAGGFVGADTIAGLLTIPSHLHDVWLFIDIGTNGEIVLGKDGQFWAASAAAGPAFEGGGISSGARAGAAVINRVGLDDEGKLFYHIPGAQTARGICGSAIIDLMAALSIMGYIDREGIINPEAGGLLPIRDSERGKEIVLLEGQAGQPVVLNQEDIRQIQLAKAALRTAIDILMETAGVDYSDLEKIYVAGAFGNYIDPENAVKVKLLPPVEPGRIVNIGNAAAQGAMMVLLSESKRHEARMLQERIKCVELAHHSAFQEKFLNNLSF